MVRSALVAWVIVGIIAASLPAAAQSPQKTFRVGFLGAPGRTPDGAPPRPLRDALRELGYVEGQNIAYEARFAEAKFERLPELAADLVRLKVDVIVALGGPAIEAARRATSTTPIVIARAVGDAVAQGWRRRPDAMFVVLDALTNVNRKQFVEFAAANRIPAMYESSAIVREGGLMSYGSSPVDEFREAARYVDRILKGAKPADLPAVQPTRYYLTVNRKTATTLGLAMPPALLLRTDELVD